MSPHPLQQAVIAQALYDLRHGQLRRTEAMGFPPAALDALKHPGLASLLANTQVPWCHVRVNGAVVQRLLERERYLEQERVTIDRMLTLGASTEMVNQFYGLTHEEVALRRQMLSLPERRGRWPVLTEAEEVKAWQRCDELAKERGIDPHDDAALLTVGMDIAEAQGLALVLVWNVIRSWVEKKLATSR
jgi:Protein of unknown function (DUF2857)